MMMGPVHVVKPSLANHVSESESRKRSSLHEVARSSLKKYPARNTGYKAALSHTTQSLCTLMHKHLALPFTIQNLPRSPKYRSNRWNSFGEGKKFLKVWILWFKMRRSCELCKAMARMYCDSDQANLCWDCDAKVHSANFLVARHSRSLLCHICHSPTTWNAYGAKLDPTVSVCLSCVDNSGGFKELDKVEESPPDEVVHTEDEYDESEDDYSDEEQLSGDDEDGENQVVPLSLTPPPQEACSSDGQASSSWFSNRDGDYSLKRLHENDTDLSSDDDRILSYRVLNKRMTPSSMAARGGEIAPIDSLTRQLKSRRIEASAQNGQSVSISAVIVDPLRRFHEAK